MDNVEHKEVYLNDQYLISETSKVFSLHNNRYLKPMLRGGYHCVEIKCNGRRNSPRIHRLMAETFIPNPNGCNVVNHIDGNRLNNHKDNLEWVTQSENVQHAIDNKLIKHNPPTRAVQQIDLSTGDIINTFDSITMASQAIGLHSSSNITTVCKGTRKSCGGYGWKYVDESVDISDTNIWKPIKIFEQYYVSILHQV